MAIRGWIRRSGFLIVFVAAFGLSVTACGGDESFGVGDAAPEFSLSEAAGGDVALAGYQGRSVLLYFHMADG